MNGPLTQPQRLVIETTERGLRYGASWLLSLMVHLALIIGAVWVWNTDRSMTPDLTIEVALVDGDVPNVAEQPAVPTAAQETFQPPVKEPTAIAPAKHERKPAAMAHSVPRAELLQPETRSEPQRVTSEPRLPEAQAETPSPSASVGVSEPPPTEPLLAPVPAIPAPETVEKVTAGQQEPQPAETVVAHNAPLEPTQPAPPATTPEISQPPRSDATSQVSVSRLDYGWLAEALWSRVEKGKRYPHQARINQWEGKVVVRAVIREDGELIGLDLARSSGHLVLDEDAMASVKQAFPLRLPRALGKTQVALQIPINYQLDR